MGGGSATDSSTTTVDPAGGKQPAAAAMFETNAGGAAHKVTPLVQFRRFLILGTSGGSFYATEDALAAEAAGQLLEALLLGGELDGLQAVCEIEAVSCGGRAAKQGPAIKALAYCARLSPDPAVKAAAYAIVSKVCRTGTALFEFVGLCEGLGTTSGWGRAHRRACGKWYTEAHPRALAQAVTKYRQRGGWAHLDVLRLAHANPGKADPALRFVFRYVAKGLAAARAEAAAAATEGAVAGVEAYLAAVDAARESESAEEVASLIREQGLAREHCPSELHGSPVVWRALLEAGKGMPPTALIRNLNKMTAIGLLDDEADDEGSALGQVLATLDDADRLAAARVHPFSVLLAQKQYAAGAGDKGGLEWEPKPEVVDGLGRAFVGAFKTVQPTSKRIIQAIDVSGSMAWSPVCGSSSMSAREGAAALSWLTASREPWCRTVGFGNTVLDVDFGAVGSLDQAVAATSALPDGPLDVVLMLDCTGSMGTWIEAAKAKLKAITTQLAEWFNTEGALRVGFIGYRDHNDHMQLEVAPLTESTEAVQTVIDRQQASGGGDLPEDVAGAFKEAIGLAWRPDATKLLIHIADAPCHGKKYHGGAELGDAYPAGDPNGLEPSEQVAALARAGVDYCLYDVGGGNEVAPMAAVLKASYDAARAAAGGGEGQPMAVETLGHAADKLETAVLRTVERSAYGGSDCASPILWALENRVEAEAFVIYTDSETTPGATPVPEAIRRYREEMGLPGTRVVVVGLAANRFTVADPEDPLMLDMAGFDSASPQILAAFLEGAI